LPACKANIIAQRLPNYVTLISVGKRIVIGRFGISCHIYNVVAIAFAQANTHPFSIPNRSCLNAGVNCTFSLLNKGAFYNPNLDRNYDVLD